MLTDEPQIRDADVPEKSVSDPHQKAERRESKQAPNRAKDIVHGANIVLAGSRHG